MCMCVYTHTHFRNMYNKLRKITSSSYIVLAMGYMVIAGVETTFFHYLFISYVLWLHGAP